MLENKRVMVLVAIRAYILIKVETGDIRQVINALRRLEGVISADLVTGPYDAIMVVEATDMNEIAELVADKIVRIPGIASTVTCLAIEASN